MKFNIYNNNNEPTEVEIREEEIEGMIVSVINGYECVAICYDGESPYKYCSSYKGIEEYKHNCYIVNKNLIKHWIELEKDEIPTGYSIGEYRLKKFTGDNGKTEKWIVE